MGGEVISSLPALVAGLRYNPIEPCGYGRCKPKMRYLSDRAPYDYNHVIYQGTRGICIPHTLAHARAATTKLLDRVLQLTIRVHRTTDAAPHSLDMPGLRSGKTPGCAAGGENIASPAGTAAHFWELELRSAL